MNRSLTEAKLLCLAFEDDSDSWWDSDDSFDLSDEDNEQMIFDSLLLDNHWRMPVPNSYVSFGTLHLCYDSATCYRLFRFHRDDLPALLHCFRLPDFIVCEVIFI